jgi:hypothetical protein
MDCAILLLYDALVAESEVMPWLDDEDGYAQAMFRV